MFLIIGRYSNENSLLPYKPMIKDTFEVEVGGKRVTVKSKKQVALSALKEIQRAFAHSRVSETSLQRSLVNQRVNQA